MSGTTEVIENNAEGGGSGVYVGPNGIFEMNGGIVSGNVGAVGNVLVDTGTASLTVSGNAIIGWLRLESTVVNPVKIASPGFNGAISVGMFGAYADILNVIQAWEGKTIVQAASGYTLTASDIARFTLEEFRGTGVSPPVIQPISDTHKIGDTGADMGKLVMNAFPVADINDLQKIGTGEDGWTFAAKYRQTGNIILTGDWTPIGNLTNMFTGSYDGGGYTISGLHISSGQYLGMFAYIGNGGKVENLGLINVEITGNNTNVGGIAGGLASGSTIKNCYVTGNVSGTNFVGGIAGYNNEGNIQNCYVTGSVTGTDYVGGIAGYNSAGNISNCVALNESVTVTGTNIGRIVGNDGGTLQNNYAWSGMELMRNSSIVTPAPGITGKDGADITAELAKTETSWTNSGRWTTANGASVWNFSDSGMWMWDNTNKRPKLKNELSQAWPTYFVTGVKGDPFIITSLAELGYVGKGAWGNTPNPSGYEGWTHDAHYRQDRSFELSGSWTPIGTPSYPFNGSYNGSGYTISNLTTIASDFDTGLFGVISASGTVENLGLTGVSISVGSYVGGIAANNSGTIQNCYVTGNITGETDVGGIAGNNNGTIQNCYVTGSVTGERTVGGITSNNGYNGTIQNCYVTANIEGNQNIGGIAGYNYGTIQNCYVTGSVTDEGNVAGDNGCIGGIVGFSAEGTVQNCYVTGSVTGEYSIGGIAGGTRSSIIKNCYVTGSVTGSIGFVGGIVGYLQDGTVQNCYVTGSVTGSLECVGGIVGDFYGTVQNCVALNASVTITDPDTYVGRIAGAGIGIGGLSANYAWSGMTLTGGTTDVAPNGKDGADISAENAKTKNTWTTAGFTFGGSSPWVWNDGKMPSLKDVGTAQEWPPYFPFNSIAELSTWLTTQDSNTIDTAYHVKLNVSNLNGVATVLTNSNKYVNLDFSGSTIDSIGESAFISCTRLTGITIPKSVTTIGSQAFFNCSILANVTFEAGSLLTTIGIYAFQNCIKLTGITIPVSVTKFEEFAFAGCTSLTSITIPETVITVGSNVFYQWDDKQIIKVPWANGSQPDGWNANWTGNPCSAVIEYWNGSDWE